MQEADLVIRLKCVGCGEKFQARIVLLNEISLRADFCDACRLKVKALPDFLPKYLTCGTSDT